MSKWLEVKQIKGEFYISSADFSNVVKEYKDKIYELEEENKMLKWELERIKKELEWAKKSWEEFAYKRANSNAENKNLKSELSKFSEAYKKYRDYEKEELAESCYDLARENESLKEEINKLEFDIEAWNKLKAVREDKERILNEEIRGLRDKKYSYWEPVVSSWPCFARWNSN